MTPKFHFFTLISLCHQNHWKLENYEKFLSLFWVTALPLMTPRKLLKKGVFHLPQAPLPKNSQPSFAAVLPSAVVPSSTPMGEIKEKKSIASRYQPGSLGSFCLGGEKTREKNRGIHAVLAPKIWEDMGYCHVFPHVLLQRACAHKLRRFVLLTSIPVFGNCSFFLGEKEAPGPEAPLVFPSAKLSADAPGCLRSKA